MMFTPSFFAPPFHRRLPPPYYNPPVPNSPIIEPELKQNLRHNSQNSSNKIPTQSSKTQKSTTQKQNSSSENPQTFTIAGITLYFDDILIICLLFFLYSEGVKDEMLFISLILLLLS